MEAGERTRQSFGRRLRALRDRAGLSADDFAKRIQIHVNSLYRLERGDQWVGADVLERIGDELKLDLSRLFTDAATPPPTLQEALAVLARELARAPDPLAARVTRLGPRDRQYVEDLVRGLEDNPSSSEPGKGAPERGK